MAATLTLGAPGIYFDPGRSVPALGGVRMDVAAFAGIAPRGPAREPDPGEDLLFAGPTVHLRRRRSLAVPVESFDDYRRRFGGFEGPGRLPFAVASFFEQGGRRAYVVRVVHDTGDPFDAGAVARGEVPGVLPSAGTFALRARNEGSWGNRLRAALGFSLAPLAFGAATPGELTLEAGDVVPAGTLLRLTQPGGVRSFRFVAAVVLELVPGRPGSRRRLVLDVPLALPPERAEVVEGDLLIADGAGLVERFRGAGLSAAHPHWLASVLCHESELVLPDASWVEGDLLPAATTGLGEPALPPVEPPQFAGGEDRWGDLVPDDFFDSGWVAGDPEPGAGVHALTHLTDLAAVVVPDLYSPGPLAPIEEVVEPPSLAGPTFEPCVELPPAPPDQAPPDQDLPGLALDPLAPADLETIVGLQLRLVELAERLEAFVVLLDVPPGLDQAKVLRWRARFDSSYVAAYHPWLAVARADDARDALIRVNPSAAAAGIIARQELLFGIPHGPSNAIAAEAVDVAERVSPGRHDELHQAAVNVFVAERDGIALAAGRTLSRDPAYRQLSVRRLLLALRRALEQQMQWLVFEPNTPALWADVRHQLRGYLRQLYHAGAFRGASEDESYFVRCDATLNPPRVLDAGQLVVEIGVAPSEPVEFIVLRLTRDGDGTLAVTE